MKCPFCQTDASAAAKYCPQCGKKMDVTFKQISSELTQQDHDEKTREKINESMRILAIGVFLFILALVILIAIPSPRKPYVMPVYRVDYAQQIDEVHVEEVEPPLFEIPE